MQRFNLLVVIIGLTLMNNNLFAYDTKYTHDQITDQSIGKSNLDKYLISYLGFPKGKDTLYNGISITELIKAGSKNEDGYLVPPRAENHFWNPIYDHLTPIRTNNGGLSDLLSGDSSKEWALGNFDCAGPLVSGNNSISSSCNDYSWNKAREEFYQAVTGTDQTSRDLHFKNMYECLGRILHLIEDMGVPAHTRNDFNGHLSVAPRYWPFLGNLYEYHVEMQADPHNKKSQNYILNMAKDNVTPSMIPRFDTPQEYWGKSLYDGTNPDVTTTINAGLAEYTNANFLSADAMFPDNLSPQDKHYFPYPKVASLDTPVSEYVTAEDGKTDVVKYFNKKYDGDSGYRLVGATYFNDYIIDGLQQDKDTYRFLNFFLDDTVHEAYAQKLIPKTISYGAGLINYFFRGTMSIQDNKIQTFNGKYHITLFVTNTTSTNEEMDDGYICLVIHCPDRNRYINVPEAKGTRDIASGAYLDFDIPKTLITSSLNGILDLYVVYQGNLSRGTAPDETNAVCVGYQQIEYFSPNPNDRAVITVSFCDADDPSCSHDDGCFNPDIPHTNGPATLGFLGCVGNLFLFPGCKFILSIENVSGAYGETFLGSSQADGHCTWAEIGNVINDINTYDRSNVCKTAYCNYPEEIPFVLNVHVPGPGFVQFDIVLINITTGSEVDRKKYRRNLVTPMYHNGQTTNCL